MKRYQRLERLGLSLGITVLTILVGSEVFADTNRHTINSSGSYNADGTEYTITAGGEDYYTHETHSGDWVCDDLPNVNAIRLCDAWVKYYFKVPAYMYDQKLIEKVRVRIKVDKVDWATGADGRDAPHLSVYDFQDVHWDYWYEFAECGDGNYKTYEATTPGIYADDSNEHIAHPGSWEEYRIPIEIDAPDGEGAAPGDDDAEVDIDEIQVTLFLRELKVITPAEKKFDFGNLYIPTNPTNSSAKEYNESRKQTFSFKNTGQSRTMDWSISSENLSEVKFSESGGSLPVGETKNVDVWLQPSGDINITPIESTGVLKGNAWKRDSDGAIRLTQNASNLNGQVEYASLAPGDKWSVSGEFWTGRGSGADAFYIYAFAAETPGWEDGNNGQYSINFDEYQDEIQLKYDGNTLCAVPQPGLDNSQWRPFKVIFHKGAFSIWLDGKLKLSYKDNNYQSRMSNNLFGFGARTGGITNEHWVKNMQWSKHTHAIHLASTCGDVDIPVSAKAYQTIQVSYVSPEKGSNNKVNVALNADVHFKVESSAPFNPGAQLGGYLWKKVAGQLTPSELDALTPDQFEGTTGPDKYYYSLPDPGEFTVYAETYENINSRKVESDALAIPLRVWIRPTVNNAPPQSAINDNLVSWYDSKYVGVKGEPVYLMADGETKNGAPDEMIVKYLWDFDNDWQTIELEQPAGQVKAYIWNSSNLSGSIKCKAVTNYGVKSDEKPFNLKIYETAVLDSKGPYTGKPTKPVELACVMNQTSYPGATYEYQWRANGTPTEGTLKGSATQKTDYWEETAITGEGTLKGSATQETGYVKLTPNETSKNGQVEYANLSLSENWSVSGDFWSGGSSGGADAFYVYAFATETPTSEDSAKKQYSINYDEYQDQIQLKYDGSTLKAVAQSSIDNSSWRSFKVVCTNGKFQIYLDNSLKLEHDDSANYAARITNNLFGFGARTGGATNEHRVRNMQWTKRILRQENYIELTPNQTGVNGQAEYSDLQLGNKWSVSGEFWSGSGPGSYFYIYTHANGTPQENSAKGQYCVNYNEWLDQIELKYNGDVTLGTVSQPDLNNNQWRPFAVRCDQGVFKIYLDHQLRLEYNDSANYADRTTNNLFGFGARTDSSDNYHRIRNMQWTLGTTTTTDGAGKAKYTWTESDTYNLEAEVVVKTAEGLVLIDIDTTTATIEAGKPTAMPGGPYRGGIDGGNYSPIQFSGNNPDYIESDDVGKITEWEWSFGEDQDTGTIWNPTCAFDKAGQYTVSLKVRSEFGKWSYPKTAGVNVIDGKIAGYVRAADLRTPVKEVRLTLSSSHVDENVLAQIAASDERLHTTGDGSIWTLTDDKGYYVFEHIPLGSYRIRASKGEGDDAHEFQTNIKATEITLDAPNQLAIDFVDISVYPVGGRIVYSIQKNGMDVLVETVKVKAQSAGGGGLIESLPSDKSLSATGVNYSMPLFAGQYLFLAERSDRDIRIKKETRGYDPNTQLVTISDARTDIDFIDYTTRKLTVFVQDSGGYLIASQTVTISGDNGQAEGVSDETDGKFVVNLNPGIYTVKVQGADPEEKEVDLTAGDEAVKMTIPSKIELSIGPRPKLLDVSDDFIEQFGLTSEDNPEGYMYYYPPEPRTHNYLIKATSNGHPIEDFALFVTDEVSMMTPDPPEEQELFVNGDEGEYKMTAGLPKKTTDDPPLATTKTIKFRATKDGYKESDKVEDTVIVLGDVLEGSAAKIVSIPTVNYTVLHDPPGDGSYAYLDDSMSIKGIIFGMDIKIKDEEIPVYPSPWSKEREINGEEYGKNDTEYKGLLGYQNSDSTLGHFVWGAALEAISGGYVVGLGPFGYALQLLKMGVKAGALNACNNNTFVQYEVSPKRHLETPSGDELPDLLGPGKGDIYYGEGWTLGLQTKYRLGIEFDTSTETWKLTTEQIETYDILDRTNQYIYTIRDIENIITNLSKIVADLEEELTKEEDTNGTGTDTYKKKDGEKKKLESSKKTWDDLLKANLAYAWNKDYLTQGKSFEDFKEEKGGDLKDGETLIFSAGPTFEYSRTISAEHSVSYSTEISVESNSKFGQETELFTGTDFFGNGIKLAFKAGSEASIGSGVSFGSEWESGQSIEQSVGFVLNDNDVGDNYATRVYADPKWGTPIFFQDAGSISSDPWERGTNKAVDLTLDLVEEPANSIPFDYQDGAHYKVKVTYTGMRELQTNWIDFVIYSLWTDNPDNLTVHFNGQPGPYQFALSKQSPETTFEVSLYPPKSDQRNSEEKEYSTIIEADESADCYQINRVLTLKPKFADLRAPRAVITAPYPGQRVSPALFPVEDPFKIQVVSEDMDLASIQLQIRTKQPDGVWEPWRNLSGMVWEEANPDTSVVTLFEYLDRDPPRREFTFKWSEEEIKTLGVGEYAIHAIATDKAGNADMDPPDVVFLVDEIKPSVLCSTPDYQDRESERVYRGELSVLFTDDMRATDFNDRTFYVMDLLNNNEKVAGYVSYSPALRKVIFVPIVPFQPYGFYRAQIKTDEEVNGVIERGVHDLAGNPLDNAFMWTFRTKDAPFEEIWSIALSATDGGDTDGNNIAGVEYGALDGEDEKDARAVPSLANQLRLSYLDNDRVEFDRDLRPADGRLSHHWFFAVDNAKQGATVTLKWQPSAKLTKTTRQYQVIRLVEFDKNGNVTNIITLDPAGAEVDDNTGEIIPMTAYTYTNQGERSRYFRLDVQKVGFVTETFKKGASGWNFFSVPITPQRAEPFVNLGDDIDPFKLYQYETGLGGYRIYPFDIGQVALQTGHSYFTRLEKDVEVDVGGANNFDNVQLDLNITGWHPIGNPFLLPVNVADLQVGVNGNPPVSFDQAVSDGLVEGTLYRWDIVTSNEAFMSEIPLSDSYEPVTSNSELAPWEGYWLRTKKADITLIIPAPDGVQTASPEIPDYLKPPVFRSLSRVSKQESPTPQFNLCLELFSEGASDRATILGTHKEAREGYDLLDSREPPIMSKTVASYFEHPDWSQETGQYNLDYQSEMEVGDQRLWQLTIYTDQSNVPMILSWEKSIEQVPSDIMLTIRRIGEEWQDMRKIHKMELVSDVRITEIGFEIRAQRLAIDPPPGTKETKLLPCYPNPFNTEVWIPYELKEGVEAEVEIRIYDIAGELVHTLTPTNSPAHWDGRNQKGKKVASGIYIYLFRAGGYTATGKMAICR